MATEPFVEKPEVVGLLTVLFRVDAMAFVIELPVEMATLWLRR
jgi:hypothetical protein